MERLATNVTFVPMWKDEKARAAPHLIALTMACVNNVVARTKHSSLITRIEAGLRNASAATTTLKASANLRSQSAKRALNSWPEMIKGVHPSTAGKAFKEGCDAVRHAIKTILKENLANPAEGVSNPGVIALEMKRAVVAAFMSPFKSITEEIEERINEFALKVLFFVPSSLHCPLHFL